MTRQIPFYTQTATEVLAALHSHERGLTKEEAERRLKEYGPNKLPEGKADSVPVIFLRQFQSPLIYILLAAAAVIFAIGETVDGLIIFAVLLFNAAVGTIQEGKAQNTLLALKKFVETKATVLRGGNELKVDEAALTGESEPVRKIPDALETAGRATAEQKNMVFKGTHVLAGNGRAIVTEIGLDTVIGKISKEIGAIDTEIPLKTNVRALSRLIVIATAGISTLLFLIGILYGKSIKEMFTTVVSLSVSIIPEGLPIVMTLVLASGVWRMSKRNALVKKLQAVEALGQARVIAVDK